MKSEVQAKQWQLIFRSFLGVHIPSSEVNLGVAHFTWCFLLVSCAKRIWSTELSTSETSQWPRRKM
jgi:flagellar biosynthesis protein FliP